MTLPRLGRLETVPADEHPHLVARSVAAMLAAWPHAAEVGVAEIDPAHADTAACSEVYDVPLAAGANCVVVAGRRGGEERVAACVVRSDTRVDVNGRVKRELDVRKASFLAMERAVEESGMEHGGITPIGLPASWRLLVDARVLEVDTVLVGSGLRRSKLLLPGRLLAQVPGTDVVEGLGIPVD